MGAKYRIGFAAASIFMAIAGIVAAIHGLVFEQDRALRYGVAAVLGGVAGFVLLLNPAHGLDDDAHRGH
jgi:drug/metabolite transporter (DMT)-like permease